MKYNPDIHHRRSIRMKGYDYARAGAYFTTICVQNKKCLFGRIADGKMALNDAGIMIRTVWEEINRHYFGIETDEFVVMPNHIHGIVVIAGADPRVCPDHTKNSERPQAENHTLPLLETGQPRGVAPTSDIARSNRIGGNILSLPEVVQRFKTLTTKRYADGVKQSGWPPFPKKLWQRNYYEHIVRNENELIKIREYISNNPLKWEVDRENPTARSRRDTLNDESRQI